MMLHNAPRPFRNLGPPTRFATARDVAIFVLCLMLVVGFILQVLMGPRTATQAMTRTPYSETVEPA